MSDPYLGEIRMFGGSFAPKNWAFCNGQNLQVSQNAGLYSLLGATYGGDKKMTVFNLPDMRGRIPLHQGTGDRLTERKLGSKGGEKGVTLKIDQIPPHNHTLSATSSQGDDQNPAGKVPAASGRPWYTDKAPNGQMKDSADDGALTYAGGGRAHSNLMPALGVNFIIALVGLFPARK